MIMNENVLDFYTKEIYQDARLKNIPKEILEKYQFLECISDTNNSTTYTVIHKELKNKYIIKICDNIHQSGEYKLLSKLQHESIPMIVDVLITKQFTVIIEEYFEGRSLRKVLDEDEFLSKEQFVSIFLSICNVLNYLHSRQPSIIHKDIKPDNIIVTNDYKIKLLDFGAARILKDMKSRDTMLLGTEGYAAPEQYGFSQTDCRTDIFGLGKLMEEIIATFHNDDLKKYSNIVKKCCELDPSNRYKDVQSIIDDIRAKQTSLLKDKRVLITICLGITILITAVFIVNGYFNKTEGIYQFHSPAIAEAVAIQLEKEVDKITYDDLKSISELSIWGEKVIGKDDTITWEWLPGNYVNQYTINGSVYHTRGSVNDINDIKYMRNLKTLQLVKQEIVDLSPLKDLSIVHLYLNDNFINDLSPLENMTSLYTLEVGGNPIKSIEALSKLNYLGELDISDTDCSNFDEINHMYNLKMLVMKNLNANNALFLKELYNLEYLDIENNNVEDISHLIGLNKLSYLNLANNRIDNPSVINGFEMLKEVVIRGTKINPNDIDNRIEIKQD